MEDDREKAVNLFGENEDQKKQDVEEEGKVEKFFELIKNLREARIRLLSRPEMAEKTTVVNDDDDGDEDEEKEVFVSEENQNIKKKKNKKKNKKRKRRDAISSWVPSFEKEDFTEEVEFRGTPSIIPAPCNGTHERHVKDGTNLDLNLTL